MYVNKRVAHSDLGTHGRKKLLQSTVQQLQQLGWPAWFARNVLWWRYKEGLPLVVRKVVDK